MQKRQDKVHISGLPFPLHPRPNPSFHGLANYPHPLWLMTVKFCKGMTVKNKYQSFYRSQEDTMVRNKNPEPKFCILSVEYSLPSSPARDIFTENDGRVMYGNDVNSNSVSHDNKEFETKKIT